MATEYLESALLASDDMVNSESGGTIPGHNAFSEQLRRLHSLHPFWHCLSSRIEAVEMNVNSSLKVGMRNAKETLSKKIHKAR
jgi:hypothetical protein